jgi:hypothetical protein
MSMTPAAELAAARIRWPLWSIRPVCPGKGTGFTARRHGQSRNGQSRNGQAGHGQPGHGASRLPAVWAPSLTALEDQLRAYRKVPHVTP